MPSTQTAAVLDLTARAVNVCITRRDSFPFGFTLLDQATGQPIDLTGDTFQLTVRQSDDPGGVLVFQVSESNTPGVDGLVLFTPSVADLTQPVGVYFFDVEWTSGAEVRTAVKGTFEITGDIT